MNPGCPFWALVESDGTHVLQLLWVHADLATCSAEALQYGFSAVGGEDFWPVQLMWSDALQYDFVLQLEVRPFELEVPDV